MAVAYQVVVLLAERDQPSVVQAWFTGLNPVLGDRSPARVLPRRTCTRPVRRCWPRPGSSPPFANPTTDVAPTATDSGPLGCTNANGRLVHRVGSAISLEETLPRPPRAVTQDAPWLQRACLTRPCFTRVAGAA